MRLGIFGGTFDPPHLGHLLVAIDAYEALALDRLVFVPTGRQPLKAGITTAPGAARLAMTRRLIGDDPRLAVSSIEIDRDGLSFTVDTLKAFADEAPQVERFFLLGADAWRSFPRWRAPDEIMRLATVVVLTRGEEPPKNAPRVVPVRRVDVSSTEIRARVRSGLSLRGFVPEAVREYIEGNGLYHEDGYAETAD
ncbi:MAG TPA: nicotinate-nucleotide adenylyltransferase [Gemmatimonadaceae bacterium]|nr:nicotinate-nucleotide adenylyltransferase [Gemmatimonadaceae bacterium]